MTPKLTLTQKKINDILKDLGYKTFTQSDYQTNPLGIKLEALYVNINTLARVSFYHFIYAALKSKKNNKVLNIDNNIEKIAVKELFEISDDSLAQKIMDTYYSDSMNVNEDSIISFDTSLQAKIDDLSRYCKSINVVYKQYERDKNKWNTSPKAKQAYKKQWEEQLNQPLYHKNEDIKFYVHFLKQNYGLNQKTKAKAAYLIKLKLPNISKLAIAKKIIKSSKLFI
jgi:hypothetical protein